jgi:hypothetical protein
MAGFLREAVPRKTLSGLQNRRIQPECYATFFLKITGNSRHKQNYKLLYINI